MRKKHSSTNICYGQPCFQNVTLSKHSKLIAMFSSKSIPIATECTRFQTVTFLTGSTLADELSHTLPLRAGHYYRLVIQRQLSSASNEVYITSKLIWNNLQCTLMPTVVMLWNNTRHVHDPEDHSNQSVVGIFRDVMQDRGNPEPPLPRKRTHIPRHMTQNQISCQNNGQECNGITLGW